MTVKESPEPSCRSKLQWPVTTRLRFQSVSRELVRARRDDYSGRDVKGRQKDLAVRVPIELKTVTGFEPQIDRRHEVFPRLEHSLWIGVAKVLVLEKLLANPTEWTGFGGARLVCTECIGAPRAGTWKKTQQRFQCVAVLVHARSAIQKVVRIIRGDAPTHLVAWPDVTLSGRSPRAELKVLVAKKLRSAPHGIDSCERIATEGFGIAVG